MARLAANLSVLAVTCGHKSSREKKCQHYEWTDWAESLGNRNCLFADRFGGASYVLPDAFLGGVFSKIYKYTYLYKNMYSVQYFIMYVLTINNNQFKTENRE